MAEKLGRKTFEPGMRIFREDDPGDCAYIVVEGRVEISREARGDRAVLNVVGKGEMFGEMAVLDNERRLGTARAMEQCELVIVPREALLHAVEQSDFVVRHLVRQLLRRLRQASRDLAENKMVIR